MSGHSKWSQIKRQKGVADTRRGQVFTKLAREVTLAAKEAGGGNPDTNFRLRMAIQRAKDNSMPLENVERAINRATGTGAGGGADFSEVTYEGFGPGGAAVLVQAVTDNKNRTSADVRATFARGGGNLGESGSVGWMFDQKGLITIEVGDDAPEDIALYAIDAGAEDVNLENDVIEVYTKYSDLERVRLTLSGHGLGVSSAELSMLPKTTMALKGKNTSQAVKLLDKLEGLDDVQRVYTNADFSDEAL